MLPKLISIQASPLLMGSRIHFFSCSSFLLSDFLHIQQHGVGAGASLPQQGLQSLHLSWLQLPVPQLPPAWWERGPYPGTLKVASCLGGTVSRMYRAAISFGKDVYKEEILIAKYVNKQVFYRFNATILEYVRAFTHKDMHLPAILWKWKLWYRD